MQTLGPAAALLGVAIEERDELSEGASSIEVAGLLTDLGGSVAALCTHGDVIGAVIGHDRTCKKSSVWVLDVRGGQIRPERYLPPPA